MPIASINNGEAGLSVRNKLNRVLGMFTEDRNASTVAPTVNDDSSANFEVGSRWFNSTTETEYICRDATVGAAVWVRQDSADFFGYVSGSYYHGLNAVVGSGTAIGANSIRLHPIVIKERMSLSELATRVTTAESTKVFQLAIYNADAATKLPTGPALGATASLSAGGTGAMSASLVGGAIPLKSGMYWVAINTDSTTGVFQAFGANYTFISTLLGGAATQVSAGNAASVSYLAFAQTFGTWPDLTGQTFTRGSTAAYAGIFFRAG